MENSVAGKITLQSRLTLLIEPLAVTALLLAFTFVGRSILFLVAPIAVLLILAQRQPDGFKGFWGNLLTPFVPLILVTLGASFFQETLTEALQLWSFATVYFLARLVRFVVPATSILFGAAVVGLFVASLRQLSLTPALDAVRLLDKLANVHGTNHAGAVTAFGVVGLLVLTWYLRRPRGLRLALTIWLSVLAILLFTSDTMTTLIGGAAAALVLGAVSLWLFARSSPKKNFLEPRFWLGGLITGAVALGVVALINGLSSAGATAGADFIQRDFTTLTGRTTIWTCYFDVVQAGLASPWLETLECAAHNHANLHNTYLQAHLIAGIPGLIAAIFAFVAAVWISVRAIARSTSRAESLQGFMGLGFGMLGLVFGLAESYLFIFTYPAFFVFFAAPQWPIRARPKKQPHKVSGS